MNYDIIGDIHGYGDKLEALLRQLGYTPRGMSYKAPEGRQAVFLGDLVDRGPQQLRVLEIVRAMIDSGDGLSVMGNHEFNAIGFVTRSASGDYLRPRSKKNREQHAEFLAEVGEGSKLHTEWTEWFKTLPLSLELGGIRVAHAWWDEDAVKVVARAFWDSKNEKMSESFLHGSYESGTALKGARKMLTCGVEWDLPEGVVFLDKAGHKHGEARLAVWRDAATNLRELALVPRGVENMVPEIPIPQEIKVGPVTGAPIFIGHHWFTGTPAIETPKVACLDWSVAKEGPLVAYRWNGESELTDDGFVAVG